MAGRTASGQVRLTVVRLCLDTFEVCPVTQSVLQQALVLPGTDFEDNVVIACAVQSGLDGIVTRDVQGFRDAPIPALTSEEVLAHLRGAA